MMLADAWTRRLGTVLLACMISAPTTVWAQQTPSGTEPPPPAPTTTAPTTTTTPAPAPAATVSVETKVKAAPPKRPVERRVTTPVVVSGIVSGVALITGTVFAISAASQNSKYTEAPDHQVALDGEQAMFIANISFGVTALFGLTALALYMLPDEPTPTAATKPSPAKSWVASALTGQVRF